MKIYLSKYRNHWLSPYTILEKVFFWREIDYDEPIIDKLSNILNPFSVVLMKFLDFVHPPINYVKIDRWDTWSMDHTLAHIILPMLKQLDKVLFHLNQAKLQLLQLQLRRLGVGLQAPSRRDQPQVRRSHAPGCRREPSHRRSSRFSLAVASQRSGAMPR